MIRGKSVEFCLFFKKDFLVLSVNKIKLIKCKMIKEEEKLIIKEKKNKLNLLQV